LLFQVLDYKGKCSGYFSENSIYFEKSPPNKGKTWEYSQQFRGSGVELARIYANGRTLSEACPPEFKDEWKNIVDNLGKVIKAINTAKVSVADNCFYDLVPDRFLYEFLHAKNRITEHVFESCERPANYEFMHDLVALLDKIRHQRLNIDIDPIMHLMASIRGQNFMRTVQSCKWVADYNPWGTVTGRLATNPNSFPILTLGKEFRNCLKPQNDWFIELDFNAAELRTLLSLSGREQPTNDIHEWNVKNVFNNSMTREEAKTKTFAWLYSNRKNKKLEQIYDKTATLEEYWDGRDVKTKFNRTIKKVDKHRALNYIVQSSTIDMVHEQAIRIDKMLEPFKTNIAFLIHDAVILDLAENDRYELPDILQAFSDTRLGKFKVNVMAGKSLGDMKGLKL